MLILSIGFVPVQAQAAKPKFTTACAKAYAKKINSLHKKNFSFDPAYAAKYAPDWVIICDMNGDDIPELIYCEISNSMGSPLEIYTYKKGKVLKMGKVNASEVYRIPGSKKEYRYHAMFGVGCNIYGTLTFSNNKVKSKTLAKQYGDGRHIINGKSVSKSKYASWEKKFKKKMSPARAKVNYKKETLVRTKKWTAKTVKSIIQ